MKPKPYLIGIAGPSGAGKSYLAQHLVRELKHATILPIDAYYPDLSHLSLQERERLNFDDPNILDTALLFAHVGALARGNSVEQPIYDFARHTRLPETRRVAPTQFVIVEGLFTLYWEELRSFLHTRLYLELSDAVCWERRMDRDVHYRGRTAEFVTRQFRELVVPMAEIYVRPTAGFADLRLSGDADIAEQIAAVLARVRRNP